MDPGLKWRLSPGSEMGSYSGERKSCDNSVEHWLKVWLMLYIDNSILQKKLFRL